MATTVIYSAGISGCSFPGGTFADGNDICDWGFRVQVTIDNTKVAADLTNFLLMVDLSDLPAGFFSNVKSGGEDIRVTTSDETTELPYYVSQIDTGASTGIMWVRIAGTLSGSVDTDLYVYYGNPAASAYAVSATYGRNNVFQDYQAFWDFEQDPSGTAPQLVDLTGNGNDGTSQGTMTSGDEVAGKIGNAWDFDGTDDYVEVSVSGLAYPFHFGGWVNFDDLTNARAVASFAVSGEADQYLELAARGGNFNIVARNPTFIQASGTALSTGVDYHCIYSADSNTSKNGYLNGTLDATITDSVTVPAIDRVFIGKARDTDLADRHDGKTSNVYWKNSAASSDYLSTEYANQNSASTFYTVGTQQTS